MLQGFNAFAQMSRLLVEMGENARSAAVFDRMANDLYLMGLYSDMESYLYQECEFDR